MAADELTDWGTGLGTKLGRLARALGVVTAICAIVLLAVILHFVHGSRICKGVSVSGIDLSGMTKDEAAPLVRAWAVKQAERSVTLTAMDRRWTGTLSSLGVRADWQDAVERAFSVGREGIWLNSAVCVLTRWGVGKHIIPKLRVDRDRLAKTLSKVSDAVNHPHKDARIRVVDSRIVIDQDSCGVKLDEKAALGVVARAAALGGNVVPLPIVEDRPDVTARDAAGIDTHLSSYTTSFNAGKRGRTHNLVLAARCIDGVVLKPGQVFSYNDVVGPRLVGRGFQMAQVYIRGKLEDGIGGGVCQVSSTLFNAVLLAGLKVRERSPHSQVVPYVSAGRDATVAYGHRDFRFENSNTSPVGLVSTVRGSRLTIGVYGSALDKKTVKVYVGRSSRTDAGVKTVVDATLPEGAKRLVEKGATGVSVVLYRKITMPDGTDAVETMRSRYAPQKATYAVGAVAAPSPE